MRTVPRSTELQQGEDHLVANDLTVLVLGTRPSFAPWQVRRFIQDNFAVPPKDFTLHRHWPEDFLVIFRSSVVMQQVLDAPPLANPDMVLRFCRWSRLSMSEGESMRFRVLLEIRGIPAHAWSASTAQVILGDACAAPELTFSTSACADSRRFQAAVWCSDPDQIPNEVIIRIPERIPDLGNNVLFLRPEEIIHHDLPVLRYKVEVKILEIQDWNDYGSSDDSGSLPDRVLTDSHDEDDYPGFHQRSRSGPWPRRTVFRTPGATTDAETSGFGGNSAPDAPADSVLNNGPQHTIRFGSFNTPIPHLDGRFVSFCVPISHQAAPKGSLVAPLTLEVEPSAIMVLVDLSITNDIREFDPMLSEAQINGLPTQARCNDVTIPLTPVLDSPGTPHRGDPMLIEAESCNASTDGG